MRARPILMHARSIQGLRAGRKTQTRRIIKRPLKNPGWTQYVYFGPSANNPTCQSMAIECGPDYPDDHTDKVLCPYGAVGDLLWVREAIKGRSVGPRDGECSIIYRADEFSDSDIRDAILPPGSQTPNMTKWTPGIHMPRWASRLTLELTDVRVERVQDISEKDSLAEGAISREGAGGFRALWNDTNGPGAWERNDWCWVLAFNVHRMNVDQAIHLAMEDAP